MPAPYRIWQNAQVVSLLAPAADAAGRTSGYVTVAFGHKAFIVCKVNQGNAAQVTFTPLQATSSGGANSKAISATPIATNLNTGSSDQFTLQPAAANFQTDAGTNNKIVIFEIQPEEAMDVNNTAVGPFQHIAIQTSASNAANITEATLYVTPLRDQRANPPTTTGV